MKIIKLIVGFGLGGFLGMLLFMTIEMVFDTKIDPFIIGFFTLSIAGNSASLAIKHFWKVIGVSLVFFIFLALIKDGDYSINKVNNTVSQNTPIEKVIKQNAEQNTSETTQALIVGDTYLEKGGFLLLGIFIAYVLSYIKGFARLMDDVLGGWIFFGSIPVFGYYVYVIEGVSFWSVMHFIGLIAYVSILILAGIGFNFESSSEAENNSDSNPIPISEPIAEQKKRCIGCDAEMLLNSASNLCAVCVNDMINEQNKDTNFYVTCVNCHTKHENPEGTICSNCGKDMNNKDTNIKCNNCGLEYDNSESSCPYCGNSN